MKEIWSWPIPLSSYDRCLELSAEEQDALLQSVDRLDRFQTPLVGDLAPKLYRLTNPLQAALDASGFDEQSSRQTINFMLREMHKRQTPYWVWSEGEWAEASQLKVKAHSTKTSIFCIAYLLGLMRLFYSCGKVYHTVIANRIFGESRVSQTVVRVTETLQQWGYTNDDETRVENVIAALMLLNASPEAGAMTYELLDTFRELCPKTLQRIVWRVSKVFAEWQIIDTALPVLVNDPRPKTTTIAGIAPEWVQWSQRWKRTATLRPKVKEGYYYMLLHAGRWLNMNYPLVTSPAQWTREMALEFVVHLREYKIGDLTTTNSRLGTRVGQALKPRTQRTHLGAMRAFFRDCMEWGWVEMPFDPLRYLRVPYTMQISQPNPRIIAEDIWAKLLWAGLNLNPEDLPIHQLGEGNQYGQAQYPFEMTRALALVWLFAGLRNDEIRRLPVGCIRWERTLENEQETEGDKICWLDVPVNKTSNAFTKPVSYLVGEAIEAWQHVRPEQPMQLDGKTREKVHFLFVYRGKRLGKAHLNDFLIPMLCRKANVPQEDVRGRITSHRARSTIASQLANAREPMSLLELMQWLGHSSTKATQHYVKLTPNKLTQAYSQAGYFDRNLRTISVLLDQEAIRNGSCATGNTWKYYDLGHGYCSYDFFDQCPHRMACAKCNFYIPKASSKAQLLEAKTHLQKMLQEIPLTDAESAAVEDGLTALEALQKQLLDVPTPSGQTPRELQTGFIPLADIQ